MCLSVSSLVLEKCAIGEALLTTNKVVQHEDKVDIDTRWHGNKEEQVVLKTSHISLVFQLLRSFWKFFDNNNIMYKKIDII